MTKTFYNSSTGSPAVFDDNEDMANWPNFQEEKPSGIIEPPMTKEAAIEKRDFILSNTSWWGEDGRSMTSEQTQFRQDIKDLLSHANWPILLDSDWPVFPAIS